jgi:hypothetical protein
VEAVRRVLGHWLDRLLGVRCVCGERVFPRDLDAHERLEHAGDRPRVTVTRCEVTHTGPRCPGPGCSWRRIRDETQDEARRRYGAP